MNKIYTTLFSGVLAAGASDIKYLGISEFNGFYLKQVIFDIRFTINAAPFNNIPLDQNLSQEFRLMLRSRPGESALAHLFEDQGGTLALSGNGLLFDISRPQTLKFEKWRINFGMSFELEILNKEPVNSTSYFASLLAEVDTDR